MKKIGLILLVLFQSATGAYSQAKNEFLDATKKWFGAWELLSKNVYHLTTFYPVDFIFFDAVYVYSTSDVSAVGGSKVKGNAMMGTSSQWKKAEHNGNIRLPDSTKIPVGLMSFAGENKLNNKPFFVMPLPSFWKTAGVKSDELGLDNLVTGVFLHEFSHSQQMQNFGKKIVEFEKTNHFAVEVTDDIVQDLFKKDSVYVRSFLEETAMLYDAATEKDGSGMKEKLDKGMMLMYKRHHRYFTDSISRLKDIDDFFLTMEGLGQYSMYAWLTHPKAGNLPKDLVIKGVRRGKKQWSQDEGFALFLLLENYALPRQWAPGMFSNEITTVKELLNKYLIPQ